MCFWKIHGICTSNQFQHFLNIKYDLFACHFYCCIGCIVKRAFWPIVHKLHFANSLEFCLILISIWINTWYKFIIITETPNHNSLFRSKLRNHQNSLNFLQTFSHFFSSFSLKFFTLLACSCVIYHLQVLGKNCWARSWQKHLAIVTVESSFFTWQLQNSVDPSIGELQELFHSSSTSSIIICFNLFEWNSVESSTALLQRLEFDFNNC
jgi:hypothetical protein